MVMMVGGGGRLWCLTTLSIKRKVLYEGGMREVYKGEREGSETLGK